METEGAGEQGQRISTGTLRALERASGELATASVNAMEQRLPWFRRLPADQRASVLLVTQTGVSNFVAWMQDPTEAIRLTAEAFRTAPKDLSRWVSLRQTLDLVRAAIDVFEQELPELAAHEAERTALTESILRYTREIAFAAAVSGPHNIHAVAHCRDLDELFEFTSDRLGSLAGLQSMEVSPVLRHVKQAGTLLSGDRLVEPPRTRRA